MQSVRVRSRTTFSVLSLLRRFRTETSCSTYRSCVLRDQFWAMWERICDEHTLDSESFGTRHTESQK